LRRHDLTLRFGDHGKQPTGIRTGRINEVSSLRYMDNRQREQRVNRKHKKTETGMRQYAQIFYTGDYR
jgi:hypothetical protein